MCMPQSSGLVRHEVASNATSNMPLFTSKWLLAYGSSNLRIMDEMRQRSGNLTTEARYRFASVLTRQPGAWTETNNDRSSDGAGTNNVDISGTTDQMWVQVGLAGRLSSAGVGEALAGLHVVTEAASRIVVAQRLQINPMLNTSSNAYFPLGQPHPGLGLTGYMFAIVVSGVSGTISYRPAWRTFSALATEPGSWTDLDTGDTSDTGNDTFNSGDLSVSPGSSTFLAQPGLKITSSAMATLDVLVAAKY